VVSSENMAGMSATAIMTIPNWREFERSWREKEATKKE
jgi:hypothetical protein